MFFIQQTRKILSCVTEKNSSHNATHHTVVATRGAKQERGKRSGCTQGALSISEGSFCIHSPLSDDTGCAHLELTHAEVMCVMLETD